MIRSLKQRKCKGCGLRFQPNRPFEVACSPKCALDVARGRMKSEARSRLADGRRQLMSRSDHLKLAQAAFNRYIRARDVGKPCISCCADSTRSIRYAEGQRHASHYRSVGACPELRFDEDNVNAACSRCNTQLSGNIVEYRIGLVARIGAERVARLEGPHPATKLSIEEIQELTARYSRMARELGKAAKPGAQAMAA